MQVLFDICHPSFVHFYKHVIRRLQRDGHGVLVAAREKDVTLALLKSLAIPHVRLSGQGRGALGLARELLVRNWRMVRLARRFRPDVLVSVSGASIGLAGALLRVPRVVLEEVEYARMQRWLGLPLATRIMTGTGYLADLGPRQVRFRGVWVQAYLDPKYFQPDRQPLSDAGVQPGRPYIILRSVAWSAAHDLGFRGAQRDELTDAVRRLSRFGRVFISSEPPLPDSLAEFRNPLPVDRMHDLLAFASLYVGEGGTMAAEAAALGTPSIFCSPLRPGYLLALERQYGLVRNVGSLTEGVTVAEQLLTRPDLAEQWKAAQRRLLADSDDIVELVCRQIDEVAGR